MQGVKRWGWVLKRWRGPMKGGWGRRMAILLLTAHIFVQHLSASVLTS